MIKFESKKCIFLHNILLCISGGLTAVMYTDSLQAVLMVVGAVILMALGNISPQSFLQTWFSFSGILQQLFTVITYQMLLHYEAPWFYSSFSVKYAFMTRFDVQELNWKDSSFSGFDKVGGFGGLWKQYPETVPSTIVPNTTCHRVNEKWDVMLREPSDPDMPWPGFLLGQTPASIWYWCADQVGTQYE